MGKQYFFLFLSLFLTSSSSSCSSKRDRGVARVAFLSFFPSLPEEEKKKRSSARGDSRLPSEMPRPKRFLIFRPSLLVEKGGKVPFVCSGREFFSMCPARAPALEEEEGSLLPSIRALCRSSLCAEHLKQRERERQKKEASSACPLAVVTDDVILLSFVFSLSCHSLHRPFRVSLLVGGRGRKGRKKEEEKKREKTRLHFFCVLIFFGFF